MFPKIGVPPNHPILIGFSIINHPFWGTPIFGNTHIFSRENEPFKRLFFQGPGRLSKILLMEEIRKKPGEVGSLSHYFVGFWNTSQVVQISAKDFRTKTPEWRAETFWLEPRASAGILGPGNISASPKVYVV